ncbi:MAG TPA: metallophosphoesterase [Longimicrobiales bacterium]
MAADRVIRIAAVGDLHFDHDARGSLVKLFAKINQNADILALCGDLTTHGRVDQMRACVEEMSPVEIPIVAVLGNHDHEAEAVAEISDVLRQRGIHVLDGEQVVIQGIGFVGIKGFIGGFGRGTLAPFGEPLIKAVVQHALDEALKLENALRTLTTDTRVVLMHYAPIMETLTGEPEMLYPFLGSSRLLTPIDTHGATVVFHGHAHAGTLEALTPGGVPVYNVAMPLLQSHGRSFHLWETRAPERRKEG